MQLRIGTLVKISGLGALLLFGAAAALAGKTQNVVLIVSDGLRWQEIFTGADPALLNDKEGGSWLADCLSFANATGARMSTRGARRCFRSCGGRWPSRGRSTAIS